MGRRVGGVRLTWQIVQRQGRLGHEGSCEQKTYQDPSEKIGLIFMH
jgi:hypothetical protein